MSDRFSSSGLAGSAVDHLTAETGIPHEWRFRPRPEFAGTFDPQPFVVRVAA